jgi:predicted enzyme related to lactoylglutathione lyase
MDMTLEVIVVPVSDVERAKDFYANKVGFRVDTDAQLTDEFRVVQLTPQGSGCSIMLMTQDVQMEPGALKGAQLVVQDIRAAREELAGRGVEVSEVQNFDWGSFVFFSDPDGNGWSVQQLPARG